MCARGASLLLGLVLLFSVCGRRPKALTILYTNDIHATCHPLKAAWLEGSMPVGGFVAAEREVGRARASCSASLLLDVGDLLSGGPLSSLVDAGIRGGHMLRFMNALGYDAMAVGNHDLDHGVNNLAAASKVAAFPLLAANIRSRDGGLLVGPGSTILRRGGLRVGVIGLTTPSVVQLVSRETAARLTVQPPAETADSLARLLDPRTDLLIVLSHCGLETDRLLAQRLGPTVDLIVGGHSHDLLEVPERENGVLIVQAGSKLLNLGRLDLLVLRDRIVDYRASMILLRDTQPSGRGSRAVAALAESLNTVLEEAYGDTVGHLDAPLTRSYDSECTLGNWVADALRWYAKTDVALVNSGTLRADLAAGPLTVRDIRDALPFENTVVSFSCTGRQLASVLRHNAEAALAKSHGILQVSGCSCRLHGVGTGARMDAYVGGAPLQPEGSYTCATIDFVAVQGPQKYLGFVPRDVYDHSVLCSHAVEQAARASVVARSTVQGRLVLDAAEGERR
jgi:2',3'-cyclic-nucleotide 2'-phosphodiesterase (5'-nucleotidase family)